LVTAAQVIILGSKHFGTTGITIPIIPGVFTGVGVPYSGGIGVGVAVGILGVGVILGTRVGVLPGIGFLCTKGL
jgi:hypothetical protein